MITFGKFMEIAVNPDAMELMNKQIGSLRSSSSKVVPDESKFNIIPVRLGYDTYNVFKRYIGPKYHLADKLLDRRGDSVDWVVVKVSNEEIANLGELATHIIQNAPDEMPGRPKYTNKEGEIRTAKATLKAIEDSMMASSRI